MFPGGDMNKPMRFYDTVEAPDERLAQEKAVAEYAKEYPHDVIAASAEEIETAY